jgi:hypothetical protein
MHRSCGFSKRRSACSHSRPTNGSGYLYEELGPLCELVGNPDECVEVPYECGEALYPIARPLYPIAGRLSPNARMLYAHVARLGPVFLTPRRSPGHAGPWLGLPYSKAAMHYPHAATLFPLLDLPYLEVAMLHTHAATLSLVLTTPRRSRGRAAPRRRAPLYPARSRHQRLPGFSPRLARDCPKVPLRRSIHARNSRPAYSAVSGAG